ncbi:hypothetical protein, partial [Salmonella enterica]|uniref:hypothetical protein n=1 Tax=Salmonella enterica TaxID=28901 RepID=UPI00329748EE
DLMLSLARAAANLAVAFGPAAAAVGLLASVLKGLILARAVGAALTAMGIGAGALRVALFALVSPISGLRMALPMLATGAG